MGIYTSKKYKTKKYNVGDIYKWETFGGDKYTGTIIEIDNNSLIIRCTDGIQRAVDIVDNMKENIREAFTMKTLPNIMYFGSDKNIDELKGKVFLSPYIGIASIFITGSAKIKSLHGYYYNRGYKEWEYPDNKLTSPLKVVHITHNVKPVTTVESGTAEGYIYKVDVSEIKDKLSLFTTQDPNREVIYNGENPLKILEVKPHKIKWTCQYDEKNAEIHGYVTRKHIKESSIDKHADDWENDSNLELIGNDSDDLSELDQEKNKYDMLPHKQKRVSDWKSQELYDKTNVERYNELKSKYLKNKDNFADEYNSIEISSESSISSIGSKEIPDEEYVELKDDPNNEIPDYDPLKLKDAISWCNSTMISMILPVKTLQELEEELIKWKSMVRKHQRDSDNKSIELFKMTNLDHYNYLKRKLIGLPDNNVYDDTTVTKITNKADEINKIKIDIVDKVEVNEASTLDLAISLMKLNNIETQDIYLSTIKENTINYIINNMNNIYHESYNQIPTQLPYFTFEEINSKFDKIDPYKYDGLCSDVSMIKWLESYSLLCNGIIDSAIKNYIPLWISKVNELCIRLYKEDDISKIKHLKENILLLGWNPEILFTHENRIKANNRCLSLISKFYENRAVDMSELINNINEESYNIISEQSENDKLYPVYIVLSYTNTTAGKLINKFTNSIYSHAALSLDSSLERLYSFNAKAGGFSLESISSYLKYNKESIIQLSCIFVKKTDLDAIRSKLNDMLLNIKHTSYSMMNLLGIAFNKSIQMNYSMICSQFVDYIFKSIDVDITNKPSALVIPKDFQILRNNKVYKLYEGKISDYNSKKIDTALNILNKKALYIKESVNILNESEFVNTLYDRYDDINTIMYLSEKCDILNENNRSIYNNYIRPYIDIQYISETKEFPVQFDKDGNLLIRNKKNINFETEYSKSHKLLKVYEDTNNIEGMKYELSKLWFLNLLLEDKIYIEKNKDSNEYLKVRARILNDFNKYLKIVSTEDRTFNFTEYYNNTPFSDETIRVNNSTLKYSGKLLEKILKHLIR